MTAFTNRNDQAGYGHNIGGPNANPGGYNNTGPGGRNMAGDATGGFDGQGMGQYNQTGAGVGGGQGYPPNQRDFASGGPTDPAFNNNNNNYPNTTAGHHHHQTGAGNAGLTGPTGQYHGMQTAGGPGATGGYNNTTTGTGGAGGANAPGRAANGASAGEKELLGKVERVAGDILCSSSLKAKGAEKEREAQALKAQAAELNQAEGLESEAAMRRQRAVAHGAHPHHLGANHHHLGANQQQLDTNAPRRV